MAVSGKCVAMTIFWLKARMGWKETIKTEHSGEIGVNDTAILENIGKMEPHERDKRIRLLRSKDGTDG